MSIKIALAGNPNCGKTTLFNALTGSNQFVGNWPGVTVEKKEGKLKGNKDVIITDLPGIYSLSPYTLEEVVARNYLITEKPDAIINIVDGTNIERNLYLSTQILELGIPVIMAVNMIDIIEKTGDNEYTVTAVAKDEAGNEAKETATLTLVEEKKTTAKSQSSSHNSSKSTSTSASSEAAAETPAQEAPAETTDDNPYSGMTVEEAADANTIHQDSYYCGFCNIEIADYNEYVTHMQAHGVQ